MTTPVLTKKEKRKSLSAIKNRKKPHKSILAAPDINKPRKLVIDESYIPKIIETLEDLLPNARLPYEKIRGKDKSLNNSEDCKKSKMEAASKRNQLFLGVNSISRAINNESIACILFANDINPKLLISHLITLCSLKNVPYLYLENLRNLTKNTLGFSSIAIGIKKNSTFFVPLVSAVLAATANQRDNAKEIEKEIEISTVDEIEEKSEPVKKSETKFTYLYRNSTSERAFVPESSNTASNQNDSKDFLSLGDDNESDNECFPKTFRKKISEGKTFKVNKNIISNNRYISVKNKSKHYNQVEYSSTKIMKIGSNPNRESKKFVKLKKKKKHEWSKLEKRIN